MNNLLMKYRVYIFFILIGAIISTSLFIVTHTIFKSPSAQTFDHNACIDQGGEIFSEQSQCNGVPLEIAVNSGLNELDTGQLTAICCLPFPTETPAPLPSEPEKPTDQPASPTNNPLETQSPNASPTNEEQPSPTINVTPLSSPTPEDALPTGSDGGGGSGTGGGNECSIPGFTVTTHINSCINCSQ